MLGYHTYQQLVQRQVGKLWLTVDDPTPSPRLFVASVFPPPLTSLDWPEKVNPQGHGSLEAKTAGKVEFLRSYDLIKTCSDHMNIRKWFKMCRAATKFCDLDSF